MIQDIIQRNAEKHADSVAVESGQCSVTYGKLYRYINVFAEYMQSTGLEPEGKSLIFLNNSLEFIVSFFGIVSAGGIAILADTKYKGELDTIFSEHEVKLIITNRSEEAKIKEALSRSASCNKCSEGYPKIILTEDWDVFINDKECRDPFENLSLHSKSNIDSPAMILYTSGSTGTPKGVINSHHTLEAALMNYTETLKIKREDRLVAVTPFFHSYAFGSCMLAGLSSGAALLLEQSFQPKKVLKIISEKGATIFHGVPYMYKLIIEQLRKNEHNLESLRFCISAGGQLPSGAGEEFFALTGKIIHQEYGSTETGTIALNLSDDLKNNLESVGRPLKNVQVRVVEGQSGYKILQVKSPGHSIGYSISEPFSRDWYDTGDIGVIDTEGFIYILGRQKRMISISGLKVNPAEIEMLLLKHPGVSDVLVRGCRHEDFGEVVEALVVRKDENFTEQDLIRFCQKTLALYKIPKVIQWVDFIPKSGLGKTAAG